MSKPTEKPRARKKTPHVGRSKVSQKAKETIEKELKQSTVSVTQEKWTHFTGLDGKQYKLLFKQKMFCLYYLEFSGNGTQAAIEAGYNVYTAHGNISYRLAASIASENLTKPNIMAFIDMKLKEYGFDDENVRKHHLFLINQFADLSSKSKGIDMYYKLKGDYASDKNDQEANKNLESFLDRAAKLLPD